MGAHEIGEIAHRFERHSLMEKLERLLVIYAKAPAKPGTIWREGIEDFAVIRAQFLLEFGNIGAEMSEVRGDRKGAISADEEACGLLSLPIFHPEYLRQCHSLTIAGIVKYTKDNGIGIDITQGDGFCRAADIVALGFVIAKNIRP